MHYRYTHSVTQATTGYFTCEPDPPLALADMLARLEATPWDDFLHRAALAALCAQSVDDIRREAEDVRAARTPDTQPGDSPWHIRLALTQECACVIPELAGLFDPALARLALPATPLPYLANALAPDAALHRRWSAVFLANIRDHHTLPHPAELADGEADRHSPDALPPLYDDATLARLAPVVDAPHIREIHAEMQRHPAPGWQRPPAADTARDALEALVDAGILAGREMRHEASLSPIALLRPWHVRLVVRNGRLNYTLDGEANTYGRGLSLPAARASCAMEMVERAAAYAGVDGLDITGTATPLTLTHGTRSELEARGLRVLDPNTLPLDAPYADAPLHWLPASEARSGAEARAATVWVPAQFVYLFCNLDEISLSLAPGSTGLATGNTLDEAKQAALTEIIERDAEATIPYDRRRCFALRSREPRLQALLDDYAARGIQVQCMDITSEFGVPCYQCFVMDARGQVCRASGAGLDGARALLAALTEVPYPYPNGPASGPALRGLPVRELESLPCYTLEAPARNVELLERVLTAHGRRPLYVELTRADVPFPVVRALVPGLALNAEPDTFARIPPRLYRNYRRMFA